MPDRGAVVGIASISLVRGWLDGLAVVARTPMLRRVLAVVSCMALAQGAFVVLFVLFVLFVIWAAMPPTWASCAGSRRSVRSPAVRCWEY